MTSNNACDGCSCGLADGEFDTERVELPVTLDLTTFLRNYMEEYDAIDAETDIVKFEVCGDHAMAVVATGDD